MTVSTPATPDEFLRHMVALANKTQKRLTGDFAQVRAIVDEGDVVVAVWQDRSEPNGVGLMLIKGAHDLREIFASGETRWREVAAIPCISAEQAEALRLVAGEKDQRH